MKLFVVDVQRVTDMWAKSQRGNWSRDYQKATQEKSKHTTGSDRTQVNTELGLEFIWLRKSLTKRDSHASDE